MERADPHSFNSIPPPPGRVRTNRVNQSIRLEVDLDERDKPDVDLEKGLYVHVEKSSKTSEGDTRSNGPGNSTRLSIYSIKRNPRVDRQEAVELLSKGGTGEVEPNHKWMSEVLP